MIRVLIILFAALLMFIAGRFVFHQPKHKTFQTICYLLATFFSALFIYVLVLATFMSDSI